VLKASFMLQSSEVGVLTVALVAVLATGAGCADGGSTCQFGAEVVAPSRCEPPGSGGNGGAGMPVTVNGCDSGVAIDKTADALTMVSFEGIEYTPRCVRVRAGSKIVFSGNFVSHPLVGGTVNGSAVSPDPSSPLPATSAGMELTVTLSKAGAVPYYCSAHASSGMMGAIFVE
jgi:plastocyanin